nr:transglutaminase-like cysteine peptidase [Bradyrhizobium zhengyangense]
MAPLRFGSAETVWICIWIVLLDPGRGDGNARQVITSVKQAVAPMREPMNPIAAKWTVPHRDDYAVTNRHPLIAMGWPQAALRLAVVRIEGRWGHRVSVARLSDGDLVLDNFSSSAAPGNALGCE